MTISSIEKEVPLHLPPARLYLDDLAEIIRIFLEAEKRGEQKPEFLEGGSQIETKFYTAGQVCDDIQELPKVARSAKDLELRISKDKSGFNAFFGVSQNSTGWWTIGLAKEEEWRVFRKLESLFKIRMLPWRNLLHSHANLSNYIYGAASALLFITLPLLFLNLPHRVISRVAIVALAILVIALRAGLHRHSVVILRNSWEQAASREELRTRIIIGSVTAVIGVGGTLLAVYLRHKYWP